MAEQSPIGAGSKRGHDSTCSPGGDGSNVPDSSERKRPVNLRYAIDTLLKSRSTADDLATEVAEFVQKHGDQAKEYTAAGKHPNTLAHLCVMQGRSDILTMLVKAHEFDILNVRRSSDGCTASHLAGWFKKTDMLPTLLALGADFSIENNFGEAVAGAEAARQVTDDTSERVREVFDLKVPMVEGEVEGGHDGNAKDMDIYSYNDAANKALRAIGVDGLLKWRSNDRFKNTILHEVIVRKNLPLLKLLVGCDDGGEGKGFQKGQFSINEQREYDGNTPAHLAVIMKQNDILEVLKAAACDCDSVRNQNGDSVNEMATKRAAAEAAKEQLLELLKLQPADTTISEDAKAVASVAPAGAGKAADAEFYERVDVILEKVGLDVAKQWTSSDKFQNFLVHECVARENLHLLQCLVKDYGFDINVQRAHDRLTATHLAVWLKKLFLVPELEKLGADLETIHNRYGESVSDLVSKREKCDRLVWLDLELTSLVDPEILELAVIITDGSMETEIARAEWIVSYPKERLDGLETWHQSHFADVDKGGNGLFKDILASTTTLQQCRDGFMKLLRQHCAEKTCSLAGSSVHCDRAVLQTQIPEAYDFLSHRIVDVSTFLGGAERWCPKAMRALPPQDTNASHRAMADIERSIVIGKWAKQCFFLNADERLGTN